ncbi:methyltransferase domain-containing protein [Ferriphaselus sp. R-1]|uniref:methyltransferase domain-containing protein n=1 Tax=Ferriphaselus sp. R-1 TaxID=1485544 RepID=UPI00068C3BC6|nr:methyltransferase domain-containing protein [Ferriphaselus sp. R-1]
MLFRIKEVLDGLALPVYQLRGARPWSAGYYTAKKQAICSAIDSGVFSKKVALPTGLGLRIDERVVEYPWLFAQLPKAPGRVLDAGSALNHRFLIERSPLSEADLTVMTLAPEKRCFWDKSISYVYGDLRKPMFAEASFDVVASISTIEHIGLDNTLLYTADSTKKESNALGFVPAIAEFKRILKPGGLCLVSVPFGKRGVHGWYQIFDQALVMEVVNAFQPAEYEIEYFGYTADGWQRTSPEKISDVEFYDAHAGSELAADSAAAARGVACLRLVA